MKHLASPFPPAKAAFLALAGSVLLLAQSAPATVVTSNNLSSTALPSLETNKNMGSFLFDADPYGTYRVQGTIASTATGNDVANYNIMGISKGGPPTVTSDLIAYWRVRTGADNIGAPFPASLRGITFHTGNESTSYAYSLGVGRYESGSAAFSSWNYSWSATDLYLYSATGVNGNIVPNASFEDTTVGFWQNGGAFASAPGVHGSTVWQVSGTATSYISLAVQPGVEYEFSFWSASPTIGSPGNNRIQYGFSVPPNGNTSTTNTTINLTGAPSPWTEYTGTFTPGEGQTLWYLGGMANGSGSILQFDSIYVAQVAAIPEPGMAALLLVGGGVLWLRRRSRRKA